MQLQQHQPQLQLQLHYKTTATTTTATTPLHETTLHFATLHHTSPPLHNNYNYSCNYKLQRLLQLQLQDYNITTTTTSTTATTTIQLQLQLQLQIVLCTTLYTTLYPAVVVQVTTATTPKLQLQPPFGPSMDSLCHPCITTTHLSHSVLSLKLPPPPCAALLVTIDATVLASPLIKHETVKWHHKAPILWS